MKKAPIAIALVLVFGLFALAFSLSPAVAQNLYSNPTDSSANTTNATSSNATSTNQTTTSTTNATGGTFSASGSIASLIFDTGAITSTSEAQNETSSSGNATTTGNTTGMTGNTTAGGNMTTTLPQIMTGSNDTGTSNMTGTNMTSTTTETSTASNATTSEFEEPYVLAGDWNMDVQDGSVNDFAANFTMVHTDGTMRHTHEISNFQSSNSTTIDMSGDGESFIFGTADVGKDGQTKWIGVDTLIIIERNNVISVSFASEDTDDHFGGQPIYGVVDSMTDENGNDLIQSTSTAGNATSTTSTNQTSGNETDGGLLGNLTQGFQNLTGIGK